MQHLHAHAVAVGVGGHQHLRARLFRDLERLGVHARVLGVGHVQAAEVAVGVHLDAGQVLKALLFKHRGHRNRAGAVQAAVDHGQLLCLFRGERGAGQQRVQLVQEALHHAVGAGEQALLFALVKGQRGVLEELDGVDLLHDDLGLLGDDLHAAPVVDLVAVVLLGVVRGGDHDAPAQAQLAHGVGQHGRGHGLRPQHHLDAVAHQHLGRGAREHVGVLARVIGDAHGLGRVAREDRLRQALRGARDGVYVHSCGADAQHRAQAARAERHLARKGLHALLLALLLHLQQQLGIVLAQVLLPLLALHLPSHGSLIPSGKTSIVSCHTPRRCNSPRTRRPPFR